MSQTADDPLLAIMKEIRDGQREIIDLLAAQKAAAEEQMSKSRESVAESVSLQRLALARQRTITLVALPAVLACAAAIGYLVFRYF